MSSFGENLRRARKARNITLQDVSAITKVSTRALQALEDERFEVLPGGVFNRGFVREYARAVGLDEAKTLAEYAAAANDNPVEPDLQAISNQVAANAPRRSSSGLNPVWLVTLLAVVVALAAGSIWYKELRREREQEAQQQKAAESAKMNVQAPATTTGVVASDPAVANAAAPAQPDAAAAASTGTTPANPATPAAVSTPAPMPTGAELQPASKDDSAPVEISITATQRAWISVRSDGKPVETVTLDPDNPTQRLRNYKAQEKLLLVVGNPAGLTVTYNGKSAGSLGEAGKRASITFTANGMEKR